MSICYKTNDERAYLYRVCYITKEEALARVEALNANKPLRDGLDDLSNVKYFYLDENN